MNNKEPQLTAASAVVAAEIPTGQSSVESRRPSAALMEAKKRARQAVARSRSNIMVKDIYQNVIYRENAFQWNIQSTKIN